MTSMLPPFSSLRALALTRAAVLMACVITPMTTASATAADGAASAPAAAASAASSAESSTQHRDALGLLDAWLAAQTAYDNIPALSVGVVIGDRLVWQRGYGFVDAARQIPAGPQTLYSICSISKLFTSLAVMRLWEDGKIDLEDDVGRYVPGFQMKRADPANDPITIRSLLMHAGGLPREALQETWTPPDWQVPGRTAILADTAGQSTFSPVNDHWQYSNLGMFVLGEVVANAAKLPYPSYVRQTILEPLGLTHTRMKLPVELLQKELPQGHSSRKRDGSRDVLQPFDMTGLLPAAGFVSNVEDLGKFLAWQLKLRQAGGRDVVRASTLREMQRVQWTDPDGETTWGLGFAVYRDGGKNVIGHGGNCPGYETSVALVPQDKLGVVALTNSHGDGPYGGAIRKLLLKGLALPIAASDAGAPDLRAYSGSYDERPMGGELLVMPWGRDLAMLSVPTKTPDQDLLVLRHQQGDVFRELRKDGSPGAEHRFIRDASGRVKELRSWNYVAPRLTALDATN